MRIKWDIHEDVWFARSGKGGGGTADDRCRPQTADTADTVLRNAMLTEVDFILKE